MALGDTVGEVTCPRCGAKPGSPCLTASFKPLCTDTGNPSTRYFHSAREKAFRAYRRGRQGTFTWQRGHGEGSGDRKTASIGRDVDGDEAAFRSGQ